MVAGMMLRLLARRSLRLSWMNYADTRPRTRHPVASNSISSRLSMKAWLRR
jgi:hypothetical protein